MAFAQFIDVKRLRLGLGGAVFLSSGVCELIEVMGFNINIDSFVSLSHFRHKNMVYSSIVEYLRVMRA